jgi:hypothetical protein
MTEAWSIKVNNKQYKMSYWYKDHNEWKYHSEVVLANSPQEIKFPSNVHLYMPQVELQ